MRNLIPIVNILLLLSILYSCDGSGNNKIHQIKEVELLLKIHGIPRYAIMDKVGNIVDDDAPDPNYQNLLPIINKLKAK